MLIGLTANEGAVVAGAVAIERVHDVEEDHVTRLDEAIGKGVRMWSAAFSRHRVDALYPLGAHAEQSVIGNGYQFVFLGTGPDVAGDINIGRVDHCGGHFQ